MRWVAFGSPKLRTAQTTISDSLFFSFGVTLRACGYGCAFFLVGIVGLRLILASRLVDDAVGADADDWRAGVQAEMVRWAAAAGFLLAALDLGRLWHQTYAFYGGFEPITPELIGVIANQTLWGSGWKIQAVAAAAAGVAFVAAGRRWPGAWWIAGAAVFATVVSRPLTGHAVEAGSWLSLPALLQFVHVGAAALWIGTLATTLLFVARRVRRLPPPFDGRVLAAVVNGFSPLALSAVIALFLTGCATSFLYLGGIDALYGTVYGRVLIAKVVAFVGVVALGYWNWQRVRPQLDAAAAAAEGDAGRKLLVKTAGAELAVAVAVLALTAFLVALPMPMG